MFLCLQMGKRSSQGRGEKDRLTDLASAFQCDGAESKRQHKTDQQNGLLALRIRWNKKLWMMMSITFEETLIKLTDI